MLGIRDSRNFPSLPLADMASGRRESPNRSEMGAAKNKKFLIPPWSGACCRVRQKPGKAPGSLERGATHACNCNAARENTMYEKQLDGVWQIRTFLLIATSPLLSVSQMDDDRRLKGGILALLLLLSDTRKTACRDPYLAKWNAFPPHAVL